MDILIERHEILLSPQVLSEFTRILVQKFGADRHNVHSYVADISEHAEVIGPPFEDRAEIRDPDDVDILALAIKGHAEVLVSGDKDLLDLENPPIRIARPRELYDELIAN